jgi:hypothetical protein
MGDRVIGLIAAGSRSVPYYAYGSSVYLTTHRPYRLNEYLRKVDASKWRLLESLCRVIPSSTTWINAG